MQSARRTDRARFALPTLLALSVLVAACGHAGDRAPQDSPASAASTAAGPSAAVKAPGTGAAAALCVPVEIGSLQARLQGAIDAEIDWGADAAHCQGGVRPQGDGIRLLYKGYEPDVGPLLVVFGAAPLAPGESARNVPVNVTIVREGTGQFFATQGDDKCALDSVTQVPLEGKPGHFRLAGRGYCTQPARAVGGDGAVLLSRFDVVAVVAAPAEAAPDGKTTPVPTP